MSKVSGIVVAFEEGPKAKVSVVMVHTVNILGFVGHIVSDTTTQFCCSTKSATDNTQTKGHVCVPVKLYL